MTTLDAMEERALDTASTSKSTRCPIVYLLIVVNIAVWFLLPFVFRSAFAYRRESLGVLWGPLVFHGGWWRLLTYSFVHFDFSHLAGNMIVLWLFGRPVEREFGWRIFLPFYVVCGVIVALLGLALHPFAKSIGASGAVCGLLGGMIAIYARRCRDLSWIKRGKLGLSVLFACLLIWHEFTRGGFYLAHTAGLLIGGVIGYLLSYAVKTTRGRWWTFVGLISLCLIAALLLQWRYHLHPGWIWTE